MWYNFFALFYDRALESLYAPYRPSAVEALQLSPGDFVLDLPCGTGQSLNLLAPAVGPTGRVLGVDRSSGMLRKARGRVERAEWPQVVLHQASVSEMGPAGIENNLGTPEVDAVLCALGLTGLPNWEAAFETLFACLRPGGRFVLFDVYAPARTRASRSVEFVARADLSRKAWQPLEVRCDDFTRTILPADPETFGGELYVASGTRRPA